MNLAYRSKQTAVTVKAKITEKILENYVKQRSFPAMKCMLVFFGQPRNIVVDVIYFNKIVADISLRSMLQIFVDVVG